MRYSGRDFSQSELEQIKQIIVKYSQKGRNEISRQVCTAFDWLKPNGTLKDMSCRVALLRMEKDGLIKLPPPKRKYICNAKVPVQRTLFGEAKPDIIKPAGAFALDIELVTDKFSSKLWNELIDRYHYLGYKPLPGAQLRYFVKHKEEILAALGFGAAAWKTAPRDHYIGWSTDCRKDNLHLVVNNARFLILPWVKSKNLASRILSMVSRRLPDDWEARYNYRPVLFETFVERQRFDGASYKASNWVYVGDTQGRGKLDRYHEHKSDFTSIIDNYIIDKYIL